MSSRIAAALLGGDRRESVEDPNTPITSEVLVALGLSPTDSGVSVTPESAMRMTAVYRAVALLSGLIGAMPLKTYERDADNHRTRVDEPVVDEPHPDASQFELKEYLGQSLLTHGNFYAKKVRDGLGIVRELWPFHPGTVRVEKKKAWRTSSNPVGKRFYVTDGGLEQWFTPWDVLHIPGLSYDGLVGLSPLGLARHAIGLSVAAEQFASRMFERGGLIPGVLKLEKKVEPSVAERLKEDWRRKTSGPNNQWNIPVLDSGAEFQKIGLPLTDVQYIDVRKFGVTEIARLYGLPPHLLADVEKSTSWGTGIEQQNMQMLTFTLDPWLVRAEERMTKELLRPGRYVRFNRKALLRADTATRFLAHQRAITSGFENADDIRDLEEMDPLPDGHGQVFYRPATLVPINPPPGTEEDDDDDDE